MKQEVNGCAVEPMEVKVENESIPDGGGRTPTPQPVIANNSSAAAIPTVDPAVEFSLSIKPKGTPLFRLSALYNGRLKACICLHILLFIMMLARLSEDILDRLDIFILEIEELYIPKPFLFEWLWSSSIVFALIGLKALSNGNLSSMKQFAAGIVVFGLCPLLGGAVYFFGDLLEYADKKSEAEIEKWKGYPVALFVYVFAVAAFQVHVFSLYFAVKLIKIWRTKAKKH